MPISKIIALDIVITMHFSINFPTVICSPTVSCVLEREASSENYGPGSTFIIYKNTRKYFATILFLLFCFEIYLITYQLRDVILASNSRGDWQPPCLRRVQVFAFVCAGAIHEALCDSPTGLIALVLNWGKYLSLLYCISSRLQGNPNTAHK